MSNSFCHERLPSITLVLCCVIASGLALSPNWCLSQTDNATWQLSEADCEVPEKYWLVGKALDDYRTPPSSERIHFKAGFGTKVLVAKSIQPTYLIKELKPKLWVKAKRPGVRLMLRAVLPRTQDPTESGPMTVLLPGPIYKATNQWQLLDYAELPQSLPELLEQAAWVLRAKYHDKVDLRDAYLDKIVLNVYTGAGSTTVWTDDLQIPGAIDASSVAVFAKNETIIDPMVQAVQLTKQVDEKKPALARRNNTIIEVRGQPFFARSIQHNGEPFELLKELGFNVIELPQTATIQQLRHAQRLDMWIVCPPPDSAGLQPISANFDRVLAWSLGTNLTVQDLERINSLKQEIEQSDFRENRPVIAFAESNWFELARASDILSVGFEPIGGSFVLSQYSDWIRSRIELAEKNLPVWATIQTEIPLSIQQQAAAISSRVPPMPLEPAQVKFLTFEAIAAGARGMRFLSRSRLDSADPVSRLRNLTMRWINFQLNQLQPWIAGGAVVKRDVKSDRATELTTMSTSRSRLVLIQRMTQNEQWVAGDLPVTTFKFSDSSLTSSEQAYHLSETGLVPLNQGRAVTGNEISIENCGTVAAVLITDEPMVINRLSESYLLTGADSQSQIHLQISQQWLAIAQLINEQIGRTGQGVPAASGSINEANNALRQAQALITSGSGITAHRMLAVADQKMASARRAILMSARAPFASSTSSPLVSHVSLVPIHFDLVNRINPANWQPNGLAGGDFENLSHMTGNGWENHRSDKENWLTHVELARSDVVAGSRALLMKVSSEPSLPDSQWVSQTPLWIRSSAVPVRAGQLVRIHGWIKIASPIQGSLDGVMIIDSIGGTTLAERVLATQGWQEFTIYRCPFQDTQLQLTIALTGKGEVFLDEIDVRLIDLQPGQFRQARKRN